MKAVIAAAAALALSACTEGGMSSEDAAELARTRIAQAANVPPNAVQVTDLFVGEREADLMVCGLATIHPGPGAPAVLPMRFVVANDPARMVMLERAEEVGVPGGYDFAVEWESYCADDIARPA